MTWLVTGADGQLGKAFRRSLKSDGIYFANRLQCDLANPTHLAKFLNREQPSVIINCAAYTAVDAAENHERIAMRVNSDAVGEIATWAARNRAFMVHFSTDYVFNGRSSCAYSEDGPVDPLSAYGRSKAAGETKFCASGVSGMCLRTSWLHSNDGANFFLTMKRLLQERSTIRVVDDQFGVPTTTDFLAEMTLSLIDRQQKVSADAPQLIHAVPGGSTSWFGFACHIRNALMKNKTHRRIAEIEPISSSLYSQTARRPKNSAMANDLLQSSLGKPLGRWEGWHDDLYGR